MFGSITNSTCPLCKKFTPTLSKLEAEFTPKGVAFLFAWSRMTVIQTGAIAAVAFVFGEYASEILRLGEHSAALYAALSVTALTLLSPVIWKYALKDYQKSRIYTFLDPSLDPDTPDRSGPHRRGE